MLDVQLLGCILPAETLNTTNHLENTVIIAAVHKHWRPPWKATTCGWFLCSIWSPFTHIHITHIHHVNARLSLGKNVTWFNLQPNSARSENRVTQPRSNRYATLQLCQLEMLLEERRGSHASQQPLLCRIHTVKLRLFRREKQKATAPLLNIVSFLSASFTPYLLRLFVLSRYLRSTLAPSLFPIVLVRFWWREF